MGADITATSHATFESLDPDVATVSSNGVVTRVTDGQSRIVAKAGWRKRLLTVTVGTEPTPPPVEPPPVIPPPPPETPPPVIPPPPALPPTAPYIVPGPNLTISGSIAPGSTLTPTAVSWVYGTTVVGTWWKNGVSTDVHTATYADTADGDLISYREVATNAVGSTTQLWGTFYVSAPAAAFRAEVGPAMTALVTGKAGEDHMEVFSAVNHNTLSYTRNVNSWAASLIPQLSGVVAHKSSGTLESYGGVLITPRHVLYCRHAHPHAAGTWIYNIGTAYIRFVLENNTVIDAVQLAQSMQPPVSSSTPGFINLTGQVSRYGTVCGSSIDFCVAVLDRDMEALGAHVIPIVEARTALESALIREASLPLFAASQGAGRTTNTVPPAPISAYPQYNKAMHYVRPGLSAPFADVDYQVWDGDSGTPSFLLHRGVVYLEGIIVSGGWGRWNPTEWLPQLQMLLDSADAGAIALGRLNSPTGYTLTTTSLPFD